ncbi:hypothetical protein BJ684DRAFT_19051 [Piptocephalis cylindrospora]|uniref:Uncharacterized protein n=1 Tax=Piptocephalis cylindrospora TaxID=1907219 RepID=A0A4P9Y664_9FUNG|nr:hypothetical protein BJ684DRAFT_19051 [Piptocephalis cylindrospora]|eukprot:RKP14558.1 hypothetical protein BJ684DRAFT_19051 [Piptocephalis cylindrospora]
MPLSPSNPSSPANPGSSVSSTPLPPGDPSTSGTESPLTERYILWERSYTRSVFPLLPPASIQDPAKDPVLEGYRLYLVLQWVIERRSCCSVAVFTGQRKDQIRVVPVRSTKDAILYVLQSSLVDLRPRETPLGCIMVTSLNTLPAELTLISIPHGDYDGCLASAYQMIGLQRFGCLGRSLPSLSSVTDMQKEKFYRLYCIHPDVPLEVAVLELIRLIQTCLRLTGWTHIVPDGLGCERTIGAVRSFFAQEDFDWAENEEAPLDPARVSILLSRIHVAWSRLSTLGYHSKKDSLNEPILFMEAIATFQSDHRLQPTGFLDHETTRAIKTAAISSAGGLKVRKALKSKIEDIAGTEKAGELTAETPDLYYLAQNCQTEPGKYLFRGKGKPPNLGVNHAGLNPPAPSSLHGGRSADSGSSGAVPIVASSLGHTPVGVPQNVGESNHYLSREIGRFLKRGVTGLARTGEAVNTGVKKGIKAAIPGVGRDGPGEGREGYSDTGIYKGRRNIPPDHPYSPSEAINTGMSGALWNLSPANSPSYYETAPRDLPSPLPISRPGRSRSLGSIPGEAHSRGIHRRWQGRLGIGALGGEEEGGARGSVMARPHSGLSPSSASAHSSSLSVPPYPDSTQGPLRRVVSLPEVSDGDLSFIIPAPRFQIQVGPRVMAAYQEIADHFHALDQEVEDLETLLRECDLHVDELEEAVAQRERDHEKIKGMVKRALEAFQTRQEEVEGAAGENARLQYGQGDLNETMSDLDRGLREYGLKVRFFNKGSCQEMSLY